MRYMDVANRLVASPALPINTKTAFDAVSVAVVALRAYQRARCLCQFRVFIRAHMETIEMFKKYMFRIMNMSLTLILQ